MSNSEENILEGDDAYNLYLKGRDDWNKWARAHYGWHVDFSGRTFSERANFSGFIFPGMAHFSEAQFSGMADFREAQFSGAANFSEAQFSGEAYFHSAQFSGEADFVRAQFSEGAYFVRAQFSGEVHFENAAFLAITYFIGSKFIDDASTPSFKFAEFRALNIDQTKFNCVPDLRQTTFDQGLSMYDAQVSFRTKKESRKPGYAGDKEDSERYRRLKDLAITAKDHDREQMFFAYELKAKRYHETTGFKLVPNLLYDWLSDYGRSLTRPTIGLVGVWAIFSAIYYPLLKCTGISPFLFSSSQIAPFMGSSSIFSKAFLKAESLEGWILTFAFVENILGVLFLFLIGLALRNRFKL